MAVVTPSATHRAGQRPAAIAHAAANAAERDAGGLVLAMNRGSVEAYAAAAVVPTTRTAMTIRFRRPMDSSVAPLRRHREVYVLRQRFAGLPICRRP